jgi:nucleoside-diphosphate-sugar epimerase
MSRIVVIGATGHVGTYVVPRLVRAGHEVVALSRGTREPYLSAPEWRRVERVAADRVAESAAAVFGRSWPRACAPPNSAPASPEPQLSSGKRSASASRGPTLP